MEERALKNKIRTIVQYGLQRELRICQLLLSVAILFLLGVFAIDSTKSDVTYIYCTLFIYLLPILSIFIIAMCIERYWKLKFHTPECFHPERSRLRAKVGIAYLFVLGQVIFDEVLHLTFNLSRWMDFDAEEFTAIVFTGLWVVFWFYSVKRFDAMTIKGRIKKIEWILYVVAFVVLICMTTFHDSVEIAL